MRWLFLLLLVLNVFYAVWHQQEVPVRAKELAPLSLYKGDKRDIQLLSESSALPGQAQCVFMGGYAQRSRVQPLQARLAQLGIESIVMVDQGVYWSRVAASSRTQLTDSMLANLSSEFNDLKHKIMRCQGIATDG